MTYAIKNLDSRLSPTKITGTSAADLANKMVSTLSGDGITATANVSPRLDMAVVKTADKRWLIKRGR